MGGADIEIVSTLAGDGGTYSLYVNDGIAPYTAPIGLTDQDFDGLTISVIPESITMVLLDLGGLFLLHRKKDEV